MTPEGYRHIPILLIDVSDFTSQFPRVEHKRAEEDDEQLV
jgi:hypothetical protein